MKISFRGKIEAQLLYIVEIVIEGTKKLLILPSEKDTWTQLISPKK